MADYANIKRFFTFGLITSGAINISMGLNQSIILWIVFWFLNGWVQGIGAPSCAIALTNWFSPKERGWYYGLWSTAHAIGEGLTFIGTAALVDYFSWHAGFIGPGISLIIITIAGYRFLQDRPETLGLPSVTDWKNEEILKCDRLVFGSVLTKNRIFLKVISEFRLFISTASL